MNFRCCIPRGGKDDEKFKALAEPSLKKVGMQCLQIFDKDKDNPENIFKKYSGGIEALINSGLQDDDIVIFMHSDVAILDNLFKEKLEFLFAEKKDVAIIGIAGATKLTERGGWWMEAPLKIEENGNQSGALVGHLIQGKSDAPVGQGFHLQKGPVGFFDNLVAVDGCIMITQGRFIKEGLMFDMETYDSNDFYDIDLCMRALELGYRVAVADILIFHESPGMGVFNEPWKESKERFIKKWTDKGYKLPFTSDQFNKKEIESEIVEIDL